MIAWAQVRSSGKKISLEIFFITIIFSRIAARSESSSMDGVCSIHADLRIFNVDDIPQN